MNFYIIRKAVGKASDYAPFVVDFYEKRSGRIERVANALRHLKNDAAKLKENKIDDEILLCAETDPYPADSERAATTREAVKILDENGLKYVIRTENDNLTRAISDVDSLKRPHNVKLIIKTKAIPRDKINENQVDEDFMTSLFSSTNVAFKKGTNVWLEFDPAVDPILSLQLVYRLHSVVNLWKVGSFEFKPQTRSQADWKKFREEGKAKGFFNTLGRLSALTQYDVKYIDGDTRLLLVAPHGITTKPGDDINTGKLAIKIAERLECRAIINDVISRLYLDLNKVDEAKKYKKIISAIENSVGNPGRTLVVWVHGIDTDNLKNEIRALGVKKDIHCLIGYGQPGKLTANQKTVADLIDSFEANSILAHAAPDGSNYCGHSSLLMNQWFRSNGYKFKDVESIQLEFKYERIRRSEDLDGAAKNIAGALSALVKS